MENQSAYFRSAAQLVKVVVYTKVFYAEELFKLWENPDYIISRHILVFENSTHSLHHKPEVWSWKGTGFYLAGRVYWKYAISWNMGNAGSILEFDLGLQIWIYQPLLLLEDYFLSPSLYESSWEWWWCHVELWGLSQSLALIFTRTSFYKNKIKDDTVNINWVTVVVIVVSELSVSQSCAVKKAPCCVSTAQS